MQDRFYRDGFTLIELMVVLAVLALIAVMLLPALAGTRQNVQVIGCLANQRQLAAAWMMYAHDNNDVLVPNRGLAGQSPLGNMGMDPRSYADLGPGGQCADWCPGNLQLLGDTVPGPYPGGSRYSWWIQAGLIYPYINHISVYRCPADLSIVPRGGGPFTAPALRIYSMNGWVQPMDAPGNEPAPWLGIRGYLNYTKLSTLTRPGPGKTWVFIEENLYTIDDGFFPIDPRESNTWYASPAVLHGNASVLAFADGHTDVHRWTDRSMMTERPSSPGGGTGNWPADPNSKDLAWLNSISTFFEP